MAAFLGHLFPIYLRFRGGKGVATGAGVVAVLLPLPTLGAFLVWIAALCATRYVSIASMVAAFALAMLTMMGPGVSKSLMAFAIAAFLLVLLRHRSNIKRLMEKNESRLAESPKLFSTAKALHVLAAGLWFGMAFFFTFAVGLSLFATFEEIAVKPAGERPWWLPLPHAVDQTPPSDRFPDPLRKEQGSRIAEAAVEPLFPTYFRLQFACAAITLVTAFAWTQRHSRLHSLRSWVLFVAFAGVILGWILTLSVSTKRMVRGVTSDIVLSPTQHEPESLAIAEAARADFARWHAFSLIVNIATTILAGVALGLCAFLPEFAPEPKPPGSDLSEP
jgi:hypothetical protein